jgi:hypothetical protein
MTAHFPCLEIHAHVQIVVESFLRMNILTIVFSNPPCHSRCNRNLPKENLFSLHLFSMIYGLSYIRGGFEFYMYLIYSLIMSTKWYRQLILYDIYRRVRDIKEHKYKNIT